MFDSARLIAGVAVAGLLLGGIHAILRGEREKGRQQCEGAHAKATAEAIAQARAEEFARAARQSGIGGDSLRAADRARADAARAASAGSGLRIAAADYLRGRFAASHPAPAAAASAATPESDLLADVLGALEERSRALAAEADARGIAGAGCEREHDSLTQGNAHVDDPRVP